MIKRVSEAKRIVVGREYLVPCIDPSQPGLRLDYRYDDDWTAITPVIGKSHSDLSYGFGVQKHIHIDYRFLSQERYEYTLKLATKDNDYEPYARGNISILRYPVSLMNDSAEPKIFERPMKCLRRPTFFQIRQCGFMLSTLQKVFGNCSIDPKRPVCPHRKASLNGAARDHDGNLVCPCHGMRWDPKTGKMAKKKLPKYVHI